MKPHKVRPILVEIKDASNIFENDDKTLSFYEYKQHASSGGKKFELILISLEDEKIEVGDNYLENGKIEEDFGEHKLAEQIKEKSNCKKVIARQLQITPEYISKFVEQYNNGCVEDLEIEIKNGDEICGCGISKDEHLYEKEGKIYNKYRHPYINVGVPKPKLTNGFVTIVERPVLYTKEEVILYLQKYRVDLSSGKTPIIGDTTKDWFEQHKKK